MQSRENVCNKTAENRGVRMDLCRQLQRGIKSAGFWCGLALTLFTLQFVHMDASLYWKDPLAYFGSGDFFYTFLISIYVGILRFLFPLCAILPAGMLYAEDQNSRFIIPTLHRQRPQKYICTRMASAVIITGLMVIAAITITTALYLVVCPVEYQEDSFQVMAMGSAYGWRARPEYFYVFILEATVRLLLSASFWAFIALALSAIWPNNTFILVATLVFAYALEAFQLKLGLQSWTVSFLQAPDLDTNTPLWILFSKQIAYLAVAAAACYICLRCALSARFQKGIQYIKSHISRIVERLSPPQRLLLPGKLAGGVFGQLWIDFRAFCSPIAILCTLLVTTISVSLTSVVSYSKYSMGELLVATFGGLSWVDPQVDFYAIGKWVLLLLPPMTGIAYNLERELSSRRFITIYRFGDVRKWWRSKATTSLLYAAFTVCLMFLWTACIGWMLGARGFWVYVTDADGFTVPGENILLTLFLQFGLQVIMLTQLQVLFHAMLHEVRAGIIAYLLPVIAQLLTCSNIEVTRNIWAPANWGMIFRTSIFCTNGYIMADGEWLDLCAIQPLKAILAQLLCTLMIYTLHKTLITHVKHIKA